MPKRADFLPLAQNDPREHKGRGEGYGYGRGEGWGFGRGWGYAGCAGEIAELLREGED